MNLSKNRSQFCASCHDPSHGFVDRRAPDLAGQAGGAPLNPIEMGMPDAASVVARLQEKPDYVVALQACFGADIFAQARCGLWGDGPKHCGLRDDRRVRAV